MEPQVTGIMRKGALCHHLLVKSRNGHDKLCLVLKPERTVAFWFAVTVSVDILIFLLSFSCRFGEMLYLKGFAVMVVRSYTDQLSIAEGGKLNLGSYWVRKKNNKSDKNIVPLSKCLDHPRWIQVSNFVPITEKINENWKIFTTRWYG